MGNNNGVVEAIMGRGQNQVIRIDKGNYFSFAYGDEIALAIGDNYYILNCTEELWKRVQKKMQQVKKPVVIKKKEISSWWYKQSKKYQISDWSDNFEELK